MGKSQGSLENGWQIHPVDTDRWQVITRSGQPGYMIQMVAEALICNCPDYAKNELGACKHTLAIEIVQERNVSCL